MCSSSDARIVKNAQRSSALWEFLLCASMQSGGLGWGHYEFLLHPLTGCRGGEPTGSFLRFKLTTELAPWVQTISASLLHRA